MKKLERTVINLNKEHGLDLTLETRGLGDIWPAARLLRQGKAVSLWLPLDDTGIWLKGFEAGCSSLFSRLNDAGSIW